MKKKRLALVLILCLLGLIAFIIFSIIKSFSPNPPIYYKYNNVIVTRLDRVNGEAETHFFYGYYDGKTHPYPKSYIKVTYHGINGSMIGYLLFLPNKKVQVIDEAGGFEKISNDSDITIKEFKTNGSFDNGLFIKWNDSMQGKYGNTIKFYSLDSNYEKADNSKNHTEVKAIYNH